METTEDYQNDNAPESEQDSNNNNAEPENREKEKTIEKEDDEAVNAQGKEQENDRSAARTPRKNQLVYVEYENPTDTGHKITVMDSYRNVLGRVNEKFNEQTNKFEYSFNDHQGNPMFQNEKLDGLKEDISKNKGVMMEQAHQRRIQKKLQKQPTVAQKYRAKKTLLEKGVKETREITDTVVGFIGGTETREEELKNIRQRKQSRTRELSR